MSQQTPWASHRAWSRVLSVQGQMVLLGCIQAQYDPHCWGRSNGERCFLAEEMRRRRAPKPSTEPAAPQLLHLLWQG